jgi:hypothetical protein
MKKSRFGEETIISIVREADAGVEYDEAVIYAALGELDRGCETLARAVRDHSVPLVWMRLDPRLDPLRERQCFVDIEKRVYSQPSSDLQSTDRRRATVAYNSVPTACCARSVSGVRWPDTKEPLCLISPNCVRCQSSATR